MLLFRIFWFLSKQFMLILQNCFDSDLLSCAQFVTLAKCLKTDIEVLSRCKPKDLCVPYHPPQVITLSPPSNPSKPPQIFTIPFKWKFSGARRNLIHIPPAMINNGVFRSLCWKYIALCPKDENRNHPVLVPAGLEGFFSHERAKTSASKLVSLWGMLVLWSWKQKFDRADLHRSHLVSFMAGRLTSFGHPAGGNGLYRPSPLTEDRCWTGVEKRKMTEMDNFYNEKLF